MTTLAQAINETPTGDHVILFLNVTGDARIMWDAARPAEVAAAKAAFDEAKSRGMVAYSVKESGERGEIVREFDPDAQKIIMAPALRGG